MKGTEEQVLLEDDLKIEEGFNDAIDDLRKSLGIEEEKESSEEELEKAKGKKAKGKKAPPFKKEEEESEEVEEEESEEEESYRKSIEETLMEEPEAAAAMDVEPFLLQLAKAIDEGQVQSEAAIDMRFKSLEKIIKNMGIAAVASAELQKSTRDMIKQIGDMPIPSGSVKRLEKARFEVVDGNPQEFDTREVLAKSRDWVKTGKIDLMEAGNIEGRVNKNLLGRVNDRLDQKVAALMREAS